MEQITKQTREVGTSAGVLLPRSWLNKKVVVSLAEKTFEEISRDVIDQLVKEGLLNEVKGIYLIGSYARGDYDSKSDVDILVITNTINKIINYLDYEITLISEKDFSKNFNSNLYRLISINEAKTILNEELISRYSYIKPKLNLDKFTQEIESIVKINGEVITVGENVSDKTIYSLVLRLREVYYLKCLLKKKKPSKNELVGIIGEENYESYKRIKNDEKDKFSISYKEGKKLLDLLSKWLKELKD